VRILELAKQARGDAICKRLDELGVKPIWLEVVSQGTVIGVELISTAPTWLKAFAVDTGKESLEAFLDEINAWKAKVRKDIAKNQPSEIVRSMIAAHGFKAVMDTLEPTSDV